MGEDKSKRIFFREFIKKFFDVINIIARNHMDELPQAIILWAENTLELYMER